MFQACSDASYAKFGVEGVREAGMKSGDGGQCYANTPGLLLPVPCIYLTVTRTLVHRTETLIWYSSAAHDVSCKYVVTISEHLPAPATSLAGQRK